MRGRFAAGSGWSAATLTEAEKRRTMCTRVRLVAGDREVPSPAFAFAARVAVAAGHETEGKAIVDESLRSWQERNWRFLRRGSPISGSSPDDVGR